MIGPLRRQLALTTAIGLAVALAQAALIFLLLNLYRKAMDRHIGEVSLAVEEALIADEVAAGRSWPEIESRLRSRLATVADEDEMAVFDENGKLLARSGGRLDYMPRSLPATWRAKLGPGIAPCAHRPLGVLLVGTAREIGGRRLYLMRANASFLHALPRFVALGLLALALPVLVLGFASAFAIARLTESQLAKVDRTLRQMAGGDLSARLSLPVDAETAAVVLSFNQMAEEVERTIGKLRKSDESRRQLLADVTHELNTPLTSVLGYLETLCMDDLGLPEPKRRELTRVAFEEAQNLKALIEDLTILSRLDAEGLPLERRPLDLRQVAERVVRRLVPMAESRAVALRLDGPEAVPIDGDAQRLDQVVRNLVENALRHTDPPGDVTVSVRSEGERAVIEVADRGKGIAPDDLRKLGQRFLRLDRSRARHTGGRGLGLPIAIGLVEAHGGKVEFQSELGRGTTARVLLPLGAQLPDAQLAATRTTGRLARVLLQATAAARRTAAGDGPTSPGFPAPPVRPSRLSDRTTERFDLGDDPLADPPVPATKQRT